MTSTKTPIELEKIFGRLTSNCHDLLTLAHFYKRAGHQFLSSPEFEEFLKGPSALRPRRSSEQIQRSAVLSYNAIKEQAATNASLLEKILVVFTWTLYTSAEDDVKRVLRQLKKTDLVKELGHSCGMGKDLRNLLSELREVRNCIIHRNGEVDNGLLNQCPWLKTKYHVSDPIEVNPRSVTAYLGAASQAATHNRNQIRQHYGDPALPFPIWPITPTQYFEP